MSGARGSKNGNTQFTEAQVRSIRLRYDQRDALGRRAESPANISRGYATFGVFVTPETIRRIGERLTWAWLPESPAATPLEEAPSAEMQMQIAASLERVRRQLPDKLADELSPRAQADDTREASVGEKEAEEEESQADRLAREFGARVKTNPTGGSR